MSAYYDYTVFGRSGYEQTVLSEDPVFKFEMEKKYFISAYDAWLGAGYALGQREFNLAAGTETKKKIPTPSFNTESFTGGKTDVMLDVRFGF